MIPLVFARIAHTLVHRVADVDPVAEQLVEISLVDRPAAAAGDAFGVQRARENGSGADVGACPQSRVSRLLKGGN
jgi:hypothetical protein